jgi:16S rRNA (cytidine1402-2'-O)-methyltransferase
MHPTGTLILVATPIGNLGDISTRAAATLAQADIIYCEDTRRSRPLLTHLGISGQRLVALHQHNEAERVAKVLEQLAVGLNVVLISDAGMPVVSDPGQRLVAAAAAAGHLVTAVPGANAVLTALAISGLPAERFRFEGFLPARGRSRSQRLKSIAAETETVIVYESPQRVAKLVADLSTLTNPNRILAIARELTKLHEEVWRGRLSEAVAYFEQAPPRGEYTVVIAGAETTVPPVSDNEIITALKQELADGVSRRSAIDQVSQRFEVARKRVYALSLTQPR